MAGGRAAAGGGVPIAIALATTLAAPVFAYAAVRNAALIIAGSATDASSVFPPQGVWPQVRAVMRTARQFEKKMPPGSWQVAKLAAVKLPLAYEPYFIAARVEEQAGRFERATLLMEEARRRRPNATSVRVALLGYYSLADAYQKAIDEADMAMRIKGSSRALILPGFAKLIAADARARQAIAVALARKPVWRSAFLEAAVAEKMTPDNARALVADVRKLAPSASAQDEEVFLVRTLVNAGQYREARALWESYRAPSPASLNAVTDPNFRGEAALPPFAWAFRSGQSGTAEIAKVASEERSSLEVDYFGDAQIVLAEQTLAARPGSYRLWSLMTGNSSAADVRLAWQIACLPAGKLLGTLQLQPLGDRPARREMPITIPGSGCEGQSLTLVGQPGDISRTLSAQIAEVGLVPAAGRGR